MQKYPNLLFVGKIGTLAVKLAREAYFGADLMAMCTIQGSKGLAPLPKDGINHMKRLQMRYFGVSNVEFAALWKICEDSIGHACNACRKLRRVEIITGNINTSTE